MQEFEKQGTGKEDPSRVPGHWRRKSPQTVKKKTTAGNASSAVASCIRTKTTDP